MKPELDSRWNDAVPLKPLPLALRYQQLGRREEVRTGTLFYATVVIVLYVLAWMTTLWPTSSP
jgi:hypothetical protein